MLREVVLEVGAEGGSLTVEVQVKSSDTRPSTAGRRAA